MKSRYTIPLFLISLSITYSACQKKESAKPVAPASNSTTVKASPVKQLPVTDPFISHTDIYVGVLTDMSPVGGETLNQFVIYVEYTIPGHIIFNGFSNYNIIDTFLINSFNNYVAQLAPVSNSGDNLIIPVTANTYSLSTPSLGRMQSLHFSSSYDYETCSNDDIHTLSFSGTIQ